MRLLLIIVAALLLAGCSTTRTETSSVERTRGIQAGQPTDLTTVRQERATAATDISVELGPMVQAAVSAAMGDVKGALSGLAGQVQTIAAKPAPIAGPSLSDIERLVRDELSTRPSPPTAQELKAMVAEVAVDKGMDPETAGALGGAGGLLLMFLREWMAHRRTKQDYDQDWNDHMKARAAGGPPA